MAYRSIKTSSVTRVNVVPSLCVALCTALGVGLSATPGYIKANDAEESRADTIAACEEAASLLAANDIDSALEEAEWCREGLLQMKRNQTLAVFPDSVNAFVGGDVESDKALGMVVLGREYTDGAKAIKLEITTGGIAGLGNIGQLLNSLGSLGGAGEAKKFRIQRRTVVDKSIGTGSDLSVSLKSGGIMSVTSSNVAPDDTIEFLKAFPIKELDEAMAK